MPTLLEKKIEETEAQWFKKIANQKKDGGFLHNGSRAIDEFQVARWLSQAFQEILAERDKEIVGMIYEMKKSRNFPGMDGGLYDAAIDDITHNLKKHKSTTV